MHDIGLIATLAAGLTAAFVLGFITHKLKLSPILGYLLAGVVVGPYTPGFVADAKVAAQFAEIGVVLLMFGVGLNFHLKDLLAVRRIAVPGAVGQSLIATVLGALLARVFGWSLLAGIVFGLAISVASTVVLMRVLVDFKRLNSPEGHVAVGWLVVEDIFTVLLLVILPPLAATMAAGGTGGLGSLFSSLGLAVLKLGALALIVFVAGARFIPWVLVRVARTRSSELFTLAVLVIALLVATGSSALFGASMALGAFLAGMVVGQSAVSHQAASNALPMRDAFAVLFFVSVGMLFDPKFMLQQPWLVVGTLAIILIGKPLAALGLVLVMGWSVRTALTVAVGLAQIGEFSFILAELARQLNVLPVEGHSVLVAGALLSITINPLLFRLVLPAEAWLRRRRGLWKFLNRRAEARGEAVTAAATEVSTEGGPPKAVVVGHGPVGQTVSRILREFGIRPTIVDLNVDAVARLVGEGHPAIYGDASREDILIAAGIREARYLIVTLPDMTSSLPVIVSARSVSPELKIFVRARYIGERGMLTEIGATGIVFEEAEAAVALAEMLLREVGAAPERVEAETSRIREELSVAKWKPLLE